MGAVLLKIFFNKKIFSKNIIIYKKKNLFSKEMTVCFPVDYRWNTIETFLPVLYWLKEHDDWKIISFLPERNVSTEMRRNQFLFELLCDVSDIVILNQWEPFEKGTASIIGYEIANIKRKFWDKVEELEYSSICKEIFHGIEINAFISNMAVNRFPLYAPIVALYPNAKKIVYPHSGFVGIYAGHFNMSTYGIQEVDAIAISDTYAVKEQFLVPLVVIGSPRFDEWWKQRVFSTNKHIQELAVDISLRHKKVIVILMPQFDLLDICGEKPAWDANILQEEFLELRKFLLESRSSSFFIFKFHPGDENCVRRKFFEKVFPEGREDEDYLLSDISVLYLASMSDAVVSVGICGAETDGLVSGTPTIEFQMPRESGLIERLDLYKCEDGLGGSFFRWKKLGFCAANSENIIEQLDLIFSDCKIWDAYYEEIRRYLILDNHASKRFSDLVIGLCQGKSAEDMRACLSVKQPT